MFLLKYITILFLKSILILQLYVIQFLDIVIEEEKLIRFVLFFI